MLEIVEDGERKKVSARVGGITVSRLPPPPYDFASGVVQLSSSESPPRNFVHETKNIKTCLKSIVLWAGTVLSEAQLYFIVQGLMALSRIGEGTSTPRRKKRPFGILDWNRRCDCAQSDGNTQTCVGAVHGFNDANI